MSIEVRPIESVDTPLQHAGTKVREKANRKSLGKLLVEIVAVVVSLIVFGIPFYFVILNSVKNSTESADLNLAWPSSIHAIENFAEVLTVSDGVVLRAFFNSTLITFLTIATLILVCSMTGFVLQRRSGRVTNGLKFIVLTGLMIPPAIVPTIWVLQSIGLFKTLPGIVLVEAALHFAFATLLYMGFMATIPREIDEAALIDGCGGFRLFFKIIFPLLKPVTSTIIVLASIGIYNDFENPLYFFPGAKNATVQLTLYNFKGMFATSWNLLFADVLLISIPPLILFMFFNKKIIAGMTAGAVKG